MTWRQDLERNAARSGLLGAAKAWILSPGFRQVTRYRASRRLWLGSRVSRLRALLVWRKGVRESGCYLSPMASIGPGLCLPHPVGIVVGEGVTIGRDATLYQHVTLGVSRPGESVYPVVGNRVTIYAGAVVVGGVRIGDDVVIGANSVVTIDVPDGCVAAGVPARIVRRNDIAAVQD